MAVSSSLILESRLIIVICRHVREYSPLTSLTARVVEEEPEKFARQEIVGISCIDQIVLIYCVQCARCCVVDVRAGSGHSYYRHRSAG
jgi:hypothetical protein